MTHLTYFVAMPVNRNKEGELIAGEAHERQSADAAEALRRLAETAAGAVAFLRTGVLSTAESEMPPSVSVADVTAR